MEAIEPYKDRVEFVEVIKDDLSNIHLLEEKIEELLKGEKEVPVWENKIVNNMDLLCYPHLFHKYILGLSAADDPIKYELSNKRMFREIILLIYIVMIFRNLMRSMANI